LEHLCGIAREHLHPASLWRKFDAPPLTLEARYLPFGRFSSTNAFWTSIRPILLSIIQQDTTLQHPLQHPCPHPRKSTYKQLQFKRTGGFFREKLREKAAFWAKRTSFGASRVSRPLPNKGSRQIARDLCCASARVEFRRPLPRESRGWDSKKQRLARVLKLCLRIFSMTYSAFVSHQCPWNQWVTITSTSVTAKVLRENPSVHCGRRCRKGWLRCAARVE
jgi:hypothetical protein